MKCFDVRLLKGMRMGMSAADACVKQWEQVTASLIPQPWHASFGKRPRRSRLRIFRRSQAPGADPKVACRLRSALAPLPGGGVHEGKGEAWHRGNSHSGARLSGTARSSVLFY